MFGFREPPNAKIEREIVSLEIQNNKLYGEIEKKHADIQVWKEAAKRSIKEGSNASFYLQKIAEASQLIKENQTLIRKNTQVVRKIKSSLAAKKNMDRAKTLADFTRFTAESVSPTAAMRMYADYEKNKEGISMASDAIEDMFESDEELEEDGVEDAEIKRLREEISAEVSLELMASLPSVHQVPSASATPLFQR